MGALKAKNRNDDGGWGYRGYRSGGYGGGYGGGPVRGGYGGSSRGGRPSPYDRPGAGATPGPYDIMSIAYGGQRGYADHYAAYAEDPYSRGYGSYGVPPPGGYPGGRSQPPLPGYGKPGADHVVKMRGLPFRASESEIRDGSAQRQKCKMSEFSVEMTAGQTDR